MPFVFLAVGLMLVISGVRNTQTDLYSLVESDFSLAQGFSKSFLAWVLAIMGIGAIGYYKPLRPVSDAFLILIIVVLFLSNKGVFAKLTTQLQTPQSLASYNFQGVSALPSLQTEITSLDQSLATGIFK